MKLVFDSSTLILLAKTELLGIVAEDIGIAIPTAVEAECTCKDIFDARLISTFIANNAIEVTSVNNAVAYKVREDFKIHTGEAEAIALALKLNLPLAVDDWPTIKACKILNIRFATAIHLLIKMHDNGKISGSMALAKLEKLSVYGRYGRRITDDAAKRLKGE